MPIGKKIKKDMRRQILEQLAAIGFANTTDFMEVAGGELILRDTSQLPKKLYPAVASMEKCTGGVKLKLYDKLKALELMGKVLGLFDGAGGETVEENNLISLLLAATGRRWTCMTYRKFSKRQLIALSWWNRPGLKNHDGILCDGAVRSGKTLCLTVGFFLWSMALFQGQTFGLCGRTIGALRRNILNHLPVWLGPDFAVREHRSENKLTVSWCGRHNTYYLFGGGDESACKSIQGITLAGVLLDEAALMSRSFLEQACARCSVPGSKLWFNCNPEGPEHWFYTEWVCKAEQKNLLRLRFTMADNPDLDEAVRSRYEWMYTGLFYRRFVKGEWCRAEGLVYEFDRQKHVRKALPDSGRYYISVDYGTMNPFSAGLWCVSGGKAYRIKEFYYNGRDQGRAMTDEEYYRELEKLAGDRVIEKVIIDPSAASFIATIRSHGRFCVRKAKNAVLPGIRLVAELLQSGKLLIGESCRDAIREFGLYTWDAGEKDAPRKENDHAMDDIRYFCATVLRPGRLETGNKNAGGRPGR